MTADLPSILLLGDSLTQLAFEGWGAKLAHVYQRRADVVNRGCSGYNTEFYKRLPLPALSGEVCLVTIFFGANDASLLNENPHHYVSVKDYTTNLTQLVERCQQQYNNPRILLIAPPPLDHQKRFEYQVQRYGDKATGVLERTTENTKLYADACKQVAAAKNVPCCDLFEQMLAVTDYGKFLNDGLHFSAEGHAFVGDCVLNSINSNFPELQVTPCVATGQWNNSASSCPALTSRGPYHDEIDLSHVDAAFVVKK